MFRQGFTWTKLAVPGSAASSKRCGEQSRTEQNGEQKGTEGGGGGQEGENGGGSSGYRR